MAGLSRKMAQGSQLDLTWGGQRVTIHVERTKALEVWLRVVAPPAVVIHAALIEGAETRVPRPPPESSGLV